MIKVLLVFFLLVGFKLAAAQDTYSIYYKHFEKLIQTKRKFVMKNYIDSRLVFNDTISLSYFIRVDEKDKFNKSDTVGDKMIHHALFLNRNTGKFYHEVNWPKPNNYMVEMKIPFHNWVVTKEEKVILNYKCNKALEYNSKGDTLFVWYTTEINNIFGPMYFFGLPGIVLEIENYKDGGAIKAISIDTNKVILVSPDKYIEAIKPKE